MVLPPPVKARSCCGWKPRDGGVLEQAEDAAAQESADGGGGDDPPAAVVGEDVAVIGSVVGDTARSRRLAQSFKQRMQGRLGQHQP